MKYDNLTKLKELLESNIITQEEFEIEKIKILNGSLSRDYWGMDEKVYSMLMHLALLIQIGWIIAIVMWVIYKDQNDFINANGRIVINWIISCAIYLIISLILLFFCIGYPMLIALGILNIIFCVIGAVKAHNGILWKYPLSIPFL